MALYFKDCYFLVTYYNSDFQEGSHFFIPRQTFIELTCAIVTVLDSDDEMEQNSSYF